MKATSELELPQIRFPIRGDESEAELAAEQDDIVKLTRLIERAFDDIADATGLSAKEVLRSIENTHVDMLDDVLKGDTSAENLRKGIQEAIKVISLATDLDTAQITEIFSAQKGCNIDDLANRLYKGGQINRSKFGIGIGNMRSV